MNAQDLLFTPPRPVGRPSNAYLAARAARQAARLAAGIGAIDQPAQHNNTQDGQDQAIQPNPNAPTQATQPTANAPTQATQAISPNTLNNTQVNQPRHRIRNFTVAFKLFVVNYAATHSIRANTLESSAQMSVFGSKIKPRTNYRSVGQLDFASRKKIWAFTPTWRSSFTTGSSTK